MVGNPMKKTAQNFNLPAIPNAENGFDLPAIPQEEGRASSPAPSAAPAAPASSPRPGSFSAVKKLQQAILSFAEVASASDVTSMQGNQSGKQEGASGEYLGGSDPFGDFVAQHIRGAGQGGQYVNTDVSSQDRERMGIEDTG